MAPSAFRSRAVTALLVAPVADDDVADAPLQVLDVVGEAEDRHDLRGDGDVEAGLARKAVGDAAERADDLAQRPVVHVHHAPPGDAAGIEVLRVAPVEMVVDQRRQQIVRRGDGVEVAGEMEVDVLHRHDLRIAAAGGAALHAEAGAERGLAQADRGALADAVQPVAEADGRRGLALARRRRADGGDEDELAVGTAVERADELGRDLRLVVAVGLEAFGRNAELRADLLDRLLRRGARDLDVALHRRHALSPSQRRGGRAARCLFPLRQARPVY